MSKLFYSGRPGNAFKDGKLYLYNNSSVEVLRGGTNPLAWKKTWGEGNWVCFRSRTTGVSGQVVLSWACSTWVFPFCEGAWCF